MYALRGGLLAWKEAGHPTEAIEKEQIVAMASKAEALSAEALLASPATAAAGESIVLPMLPHTHTLLPGLVEKYLAQENLPTKKELAVHFVDIADSTATMVHLPPEKTLALVQRFMESVTEIALEHCGDVIEYEGDGALLYFESAMEATHAALAIRNTLTRKPRAGQEPLRLRQSLNFGEMVIGIIGSSLRRSVTLIGPSINLASRMLKQIPPDGIIATDIVVDQLHKEKQPALAERFKLWDPCLILRGNDEVCVKAFHIP